MNPRALDRILAPAPGLTRMTASSVEAGRIVPKSIVGVPTPACRNDRRREVDVTSC
jgi:hypothetical protein